MSGAKFFAGFVVVAIGGLIFLAYTLALLVGPSD
jgi:hypothetical protein